MAPDTPIMRAFQRPRLWLALGTLMIVAVIVLSLMPGPPIPQALTVGKLDHMVAYLALAAFAVQLYWATRTQLLVALALVGLGIALEFAQGYLTTYRDMSAYDALVDTIGVVLGIATARTPLATVLLRIDQGWAREER